MGTGVSQFLFVQYPEELSPSDTAAADWRYVNYFCPMESCIESILSTVLSRTGKDVDRIMLITTDRCLKPFAAHLAVYQIWSTKKGDQPFATTPVDQIILCDSNLKTRINQQTRLTKAQQT